MEKIKNQNERLMDALELLLENVEEPPDANCSCFISAPCNDCLDYGRLREAISNAKSVIQLR